MRIFKNIFFDNTQNDFYEKKIFFRKKFLLCTFINKTYIILNFRYLSILRIFQRYSFHACNFSSDSHVTTLSAER